MPWWHWNQRHQHYYNIQLNFLSKTLLIFLQLLLQTLLPLNPPQDPGVRSQDKTRHLHIRSRGEIGEVSGMNNLPAINPPFCKWHFYVPCSSQDGLAATTEQTQNISKLCLRAGRIHQESNSRLQILYFITSSGGQMQQFLWWYRWGGISVPVAQRWMETVLLPETDVSQWDTKHSCILLCLAIALNALVIVCSPGLFHFCWLLHFLTFFLSFSKISLQVQL